MIFFYISLPLFVIFYLTLRGQTRQGPSKGALLFMSFICTLVTLYIYKGFNGDTTFKLVNDREILERLVTAKSKSKEQDAIEVGRIILEVSNKEEVLAGEIYLLAKKLRGADEYALSSLAFDQLYNIFSNELDGNILAEYAQTIFLKEDRSFNGKIESILEEALLKSPDNPSALTLKGLKELENKNIDLTISLWTKALTLLESEKDKSELKALIEAVKKLKNQ